MLALLVAASVLCALPYGLVLRPDRFWSIAVLFFGSTLVCVPSLHVFGVFLGFKSTPGQSLALALIVSSVAGVFTLGFAPILWFLRATMPGEGSSGTVAGVSALLLGASFMAGVAQLGRGLAARSEWRVPPAYGWFLSGWMMLLMFITFRMAGALGLLP